jgi:hypothetical protein
VKLLRSWPAVVPANTKRAHVVDPIPRLYLDDYDLSPMAEVDDDIVLLEWDIAVDRTALEMFVARASDGPDKVIVAPYRLYETTVRSHRLKKPVWCHRRSDGSHVDTGEKWCSYFGFGLIYFPREVVKAFRADWQGHFSDGSFSGWHRNNVSEHVEIVWDAPAAHLHYTVSDLGFEIEEREPPKRIPVSTTTAVEDETAAAQTQDSGIAALLRERAAYKRANRFDRAAAVDEQLALRGYR